MSYIPESPKDGMESPSETETAAAPVQHTWSRDAREFLLLANDQSVA